MGTILNVIEKEMSGVSFNSHKYCHDTSDRSGINCEEVLVAFSDSSNVQGK